MLAISTLEIRGFRNLAAQAIALHPRINVFFGDNGQGKTNTLEAAYLVTTSRSFRTAMLGDCVQHDAPAAMVRVHVDDARDPAVPREQRVDIALSDGGDHATRGARRAVKLEGKRPQTLAVFALATPIVLFEPASLQLSQGGAAERRKLLDRVAVHLATRTGGGAQLLGDAERYRRAHQHRRRALETRADARTIAPYESIMAEHGAAIVRARAHAAHELSARAVAAFERIARSPLPLSIAYAPRAPEDAAAFATLLAARRSDDARRGTASVGPHLDDLAIHLGGHPARKVASQGQHRAIVLALKGAELGAVAAARDVPPILLLDDVSSELDPSRNASLFEFLHAQVGQVLLTTTRPELIELGTARADFQVRAGAVVRVR